MTKPKNHTPEGFTSVTPYLVVDGAEELIEFITKGLGGEKTFIMKSPDGRVTHAAVKVGNSMIMLGDTMRGMGPQTAMLYVYVKDVDSVYEQALKSNVESVREPKDEFYGDRSACVKDRWGNLWWIATYVEDVDPAELERRAQEVYKKERQEQPVH